MFIFQFVSDYDSTIINHPVHIITKDNLLSPSAFIPFCEFGGSMLVVGVKIDQFDVPVCNCFQARILNDQLCYEVDLNRFSKEGNKEAELNLGLNFLMDYNEDRQVTFHKNISQEKFGLVSRLGRSVSDQHNNAFIYLHTIGKYFSMCSYHTGCLVLVHAHNFCRTSQAVWRGTILFACPERNQSNRLLSWIEPRGQTPLSG